MTDRIPLARPDLSGRESELVAEVLASGTLSLGPKLTEFEEAFSGWLGTVDAVAVSSGTTALHLGVRAHEWGAGDEVITSPFSFVATANSLLYEDAEPVFCDIDPVTLNIDPVAAEAAVTEHTAGLLPVHIFGYPAAMPELEAIAKKARVPILEDSCQALGAVDSRGTKVGAAGNAATFAFYANKQMTTGEGGVLIPAGTEMAEYARSARNQGRAAAMEVVEHDIVGFNYRLTDIQAAIGIAQVERLDELLAARASVAAAYRERLADAGAAEPGEGDDTGLLLPCADRGSERRSWFVFCVQLPDGTHRQAIIDALDAEGISSKAYLPCIHTMPPYRERFGFSGGEFPVAERVAARSLALPFFGGMSIEQVERVCSALGSALQANA